MARTTDRVVRAVSRRLWQRDRLQMRVADALMTAAEGASRTRRSRRSPAVRSPKWAGFDSVLCPIDFSDGSRQALAYAEALALRGGARLTVVYINDPLLVAAAAAALHDRNVVKDSGRELEALVDASLSSRAKATLQVAVRVAVGNPAGQILGIAEREHAGVIVVGTHGLTGAPRVVAGSTTLGVLQHAAVPVLAVPAGTPGPRRSWPGRRIVAAVDLDGETARELDAAVRIAHWFRASLLVVHVVNGRAAPPWLRAWLRGQEREHEAAVLERLEALTVKAAGAVRAESRVLRGEVASAVGSLAAREKSGLVITALRDRQSWLGAARGSISYRVLSRASTPVLAIPPGWPRR
jgi:nucleotide-binding universal stress UspA family protein